MAFTVPLPPTIALPTDLPDDVVMVPYAVDAPLPAAGGRPVGASKQISENLAAPLAGRPLPNVERVATSGRSGGAAGTAGR